MAHFAEIKNLIVVRVIVVNDNHEADGPQFCRDLFGGDWIQCSYNNRIRKQFPSAGYAYNPVADVFIAPRPFKSWTLDNNYDWQAPNSKPDGAYHWDEDLQDWLKINET